VALLRGGVGAPEGGPSRLWVLPQVQNQRTAAQDKLLGSTADKLVNQLASFPVGDLRVFLTF
jgi:hypothetical protein